MCSDWEAYGLEKHGLMRSDCISFSDWLDLKSIREQEALSATGSVIFGFCSPGCRARKIACPTSRGNKKFQSGNCSFFTHIPAGNHVLSQKLQVP